MLRARPGHCKLNEQTKTQAENPPAQPALAQSSCEPQKHGASSRVPTAGL